MRGRGAAGGGRGAVGGCEGAVGGGGGAVGGGGGLVRGEDVKDALRVFLGKVTQRQERRWLLSLSSGRNANPAFVKITILWFVRHVLNH